MAKIEYVDYEAIPAQAKQMRSCAQALNAEITQAYTKVTNMREVWYGKRYNDLVNEFNEIVVPINELLELVVQNFPFALETIANNYSEVDRHAKITNAAKTEPNKVVNIAPAKNIGMKFLSAEVSNVQKAVSTNFKNAKTKMNEIESVYKRITWKSEASAKFEETFTRLKNSITASFDNIEVQFAKFVTQALEDIQQAEQSNTVQ